jgi:hypothetical protein
VILAKEDVLIPVHISHQSILINGLIAEWNVMQHVMDTCPGIPEII